MFEPIYKSTRLIHGSGQDMGIITLWTKAKELEKAVPKDRYAVMGNLYSAERGLDLLVRNLLANPQIIKLVITGVDFSKSGQVLTDFFSNGFEKGKTRIAGKDVWKVKSEHEGYIGMDIPAKELESLRRSMTVAKTANIASFDFSSILEPEGKRERAVHIKSEEDARRYTGEDIGYIVRGKTIAEAWLKVLDTILKFGSVCGTHYDDQQKEIINLMSVISDEDPDNFFVPEYFPFKRQHLEEYIPRVTRDLPGGIHKSEYTYGSRMRSWFEVDQVRGAIEKLAREDISRAVVISLWDPTKDLTIGGSPCLNHIWFRIRDGKLHMTCIFRSHDMFEGYPENAFGLRKFQSDVVQELNKRRNEQGRAALRIGKLCILSQSAHIYDDSWEVCQSIVDKHLKMGSVLTSKDPRGNLIVSTDGSTIAVEHTSPAGELLGRYGAKTAAEMRDILSGEDIISLVPHGIDIGMELMKAEIAIRRGIEYNQDNQLDFSKPARKVTAQ